MKSSSTLVSPRNMKPGTSPDPTLHGEYLFLSLQMQNPWRFPEELWLCKPNRAWFIFWIIKPVTVCMDNISFWAKLANTEKNFKPELDPSSLQLAGFPGLSLQPALTLWPKSLPGTRQASLHSLLAIHLQELRLNFSLPFYWSQWHPV